MSERQSSPSGRTVQCYDYVNRSYPVVRGALIDDAPGIFRQATRATGAQAAAGTATLRVSVGPVDLSAHVDIELEPAVEHVSGSERKTQITLRWSATRTAALFPTLEAILFVYPLTSNETQLEVRGTYHPPLGALGAALDSVALHRLAEDSVLRFLADVARHLGATLPEG